MTDTNSPDIFTNVHRGLRKALFDACVALGRVGDDPRREASARQLLADALRFVRHHGENEDRLLLPLLEERVPHVFASIQRDHADIEAALASLSRDLQRLDALTLYHRAASFTARYLEHMHAEEREHESDIRTALSADEVRAFARESVARTAPDDARMMLAWMLPALPSADALALLARLPPALADELRPLLELA